MLNNPKRARCRGWWYFSASTGVSRRRAVADRFAKVAAVALLAMVLATIWMNLNRWGWRLLLSLALPAYGLLVWAAGNVMDNRSIDLALELAVAGIVNLFAISYWLIHHTPQYAISQRWFISLNAGLYLDEWLTRFVLWLWPSHPIHYYQSRNNVAVKGKLYEQTR